MLVRFSPEKSIGWLRSRRRGLPAGPHQLEMAVRLVGGLIILKSSTCMRGREARSACRLENLHLWFFCGEHTVRR
jgi:hypothetical protein